MIKYITRIITLVLTLVLTACGGGGDAIPETPQVRMTGYSPLTTGSPLGKIRITNADPFQTIRLDFVALKLHFRSSNASSFVFNGKVCLIPVGSYTDCRGGTPGESITEVGGTVRVSLMGRSERSNTLARQGGYEEFEVYLENAPLWISGDLVMLSLDSIGFYDESRNAYLASYVGMTNASVTLSK